MKCDREFPEVGYNLYFEAQITQDSISVLGITVDSHLHLRTSNLVSGCLID